MPQGGVNKHVVLLIILSVLCVPFISGCDFFIIQGVWKVESLTTQINVPWSEDPIEFDYQYSHINRYLQFDGENKKVYITKDDALIRCIDLDKLYNVDQHNKVIELYEDGKMADAWSYEINGDTISITMTSIESDSGFGVVLKWNLVKVDASVISSAIEDCINFESEDENYLKDLL